MQITYLKNLKRIMIRDDEPFDDNELVELYKLYGKNFKIYNDLIQKLIKKIKKPPKLSFRGF